MNTPINSRAPERSQRPALPITDQVLYVTASFPTLSETFVWNEVLELRRQGVQVRVAGLRAGPTTADSLLQSLHAETMVVYCDLLTNVKSIAAEVISHPVRSLRTLGMSVADAFTSDQHRAADRARKPVQALAAIGFTARLRSLQIRHIHAHMANTPTTIAMYAARQLGIPFSFTGHANDLFVHRSLLSQKLRRCKFVACISRWHQDLYREILPVSEDKLPVVRCGVNTSRAVTAGRPHSSSMRLLSVGRLVPKKGFDVLINALAQLPAEPAWTCRIIGDGPELSNLGSLIESRGLGERITLSGPASNDQVLAALDEADVFALPCRVDPKTGDKDGIPVVLMEAMAAGRPVISGDLPAIRELVRPLETGLLVEPGSADSLATALRLMMSDNELRRRLADQGRQHVVKEFDRTDNASRLAKLFAT
jgi:colanic acid/amylovoran biosynthesis glycosyltransferase